MVKPEKFGHHHLVYQFTVPLSSVQLVFKSIKSMTVIMYFFILANMLSLRVLVAYTA